MTTKRKYWRYNTIVSIFQIGIITALMLFAKFSLAKALLSAGLSTFAISLFYKEDGFEENASILLDVIFFLASITILISAIIYFKNIIIVGIFSFVLISVIIDFAEMIQEKTQEGFLELVLLSMPYGIGTIAGIIFAKNKEI